MSFDFRHTCPDIDSNIDQLISEIKDEIEDLIDDVCPLLKGEELEKLKETYANDIYKHVEEYFEGVRKTNVDMRDSAEHQINHLESEIMDLKHDLEAAE